MKTTSKKSLREMEDLLAIALKKVGGKKESDLHRFILMPSGGYMHHFTFKKMKTKNPKELISLIERYILHVDDPKMVTSKQRARRGSSGNENQLQFKPSHLQKMLQLAHMAGDKELMNTLAPQRILDACKQRLIQSIRKDEVEVELWNSYIEAIASLQSN